MRKMEIISINKAIDVEIDKDGIHLSTSELKYEEYQMIYLTYDEVEKIYQECVKRRKIYPVEVEDGSQDSKG